MIKRSLTPEPHIFSDLLYENFKGNNGEQTRRSGIRRNITRRLSLVSKVPDLIQSRLRIDSNRYHATRNRARKVIASVQLPDGTYRKVTGEDSQKVALLFHSLAVELKLPEFRVRQEDTRAIIRIDVGAALIDGLDLIVEPIKRHILKKQDEAIYRRNLSLEFLDHERDYVDALFSAEEIYGRPLRKLASISDEEHFIVFQSLKPLHSMSKMLICKMEDILQSWDPLASRIGSAFSKQLWKQYEDYLEVYPRAKCIIQEKTDSDEEFVELCQLRQGAAEFSIEDIIHLPVCWKDVPKSMEPSKEARPSVNKSDVGKRSSRAHRIRDRPRLRELREAMSEPDLERTQEMNDIYEENWNSIQASKLKENKAGIKVTWKSLRKLSDNTRDNQLARKPGDKGSDPGWRDYWRQFRKMSDTFLTDSPSVQPVSLQNAKHNSVYMDMSVSLPFLSLEPSMDPNYSVKVGTARRVEGTRTVSYVEGSREIQRLQDYEKFLSTLQDATPVGYSAEIEDIGRALKKATQIVRQVTEETGELDRIQALFPGDDLYLHDKRALSQNMKNLARKKSSTALQRALSSKSPKLSTPTRHNNAVDMSPGIPATPNRTHPARRQFVMEAPVQFTTGMSSQDRHLFLFTDLLLIAKARSDGTFKLKEKVRLTELWLSDKCIDEVTEVTRSRDSSFVIGWPTTNAVSTFGSTAARDLWWTRLQEATERERSKEPSAIPIQVVYYDSARGVECVKTLAVSANDTARDCVRMALSHMELTEVEPGKYKLWASTAGLGGDDAPYPLIGHEIPFAIRMHCARAVESDEEGGFQNTGVRCQFILRNSQKEAKVMDPLSPKKVKKPRRSPMKFQQVFRRSSSKGEGLNEKRGIFGQPLTSICEGERLPTPVMEILQQLAENGPGAVGIFRKSANARQIKEIREHIDNGTEVDFKQVNVVVLAVLLKDFLRSLPDCLLVGSKYAAWVSASLSIIKIRSLCEQLPPANRSMLRHLLCILYRVARKASHNLMSASNLAICIGPSLLWPSSDASANLSTESSKQVPLLVTKLIEHCGDLFGPETLWLFDCPLDYVDYKEMARREHGDIFSSSGRCSVESGTGESPSFFQERKICEPLRHDDSSVDSLERDLISVESDEHPGDLRRNKHSVTNLSRDSGLTLSDTQLNVDEEEGNESSASSGRKSNYSSSGCGSDPRWEQTPYENIRRVHVPYEPVYKHKLSRSENVIYGTKLSEKYSSAYASPMVDEIYAVPKPSAQLMQLAAEQAETQRRQDLFRRKSAIRREIRNRVGANIYDSGGTLRRSASDESLASLTCMNPTELPTQKNRRQTKTTLPPVQQAWGSPKISRTYISNEPVYGKTKYSISKSTPHIEDIADSSTLSDDDLTPHVSRSNSRGKEWESRSVPPTYEETITRQCAAKKLSVYQEVPRTVVNAEPISLVRSYESRKAVYDSVRKLHESQARRVDSVRQYNEIKEQKLTNVESQSRQRSVYGSVRDIPPSLPPKTTPPPLPPKQRTREETKLQKKESLKRQRPATVHIDTNFLSNLKLTHENPPSLPPKERQRSKTDTKRSDREVVYESRPNPELKPISAKSKAKSDMGIQTYDLEADSLKSNHNANEFMRDQGCQTSGSWLNLDKLSSEQLEQNLERVRGPSERLRARDRTKKVSRSQSLPCEEEEEEGEEKPKVISATREEINWSVTKLRALFNSSDESKRCGQKSSSRNSKRSDSVESASGEESYV